MTSLYRVLINFRYGELRNKKVPFAELTCDSDLIGREFSLKLRIEN